MKIHAQPVTLDDLMAYVDGQLESERRQQVEAAILADHHLAASVAEMRAQRQTLRTHYGPVLNETIPSRLLPAGHSGHMNWAKAAGVVLWVALGAITGSAITAYYPGQVSSRLTAAREEVDLPRFVHQAAVAHLAYAPDVRHPVEIYSDQQQQLLTWLSKRLGRQIKAPNLANAGFRLIGGRLLPGEMNKAAALFMYENAAGQRMTLYLRGMAQPTPETAFQVTERGGIATYYWVDRDWGYALSSDLPQATLKTVASSVYQQLIG